MLCHFPWYVVIGARNRIQSKSTTMAIQSRAASVTSVLWCPMCMRLVNASKSWMLLSLSVQTMVKWRDWLSSKTQTAIGLRFSMPALLRHYNAREAFVNNQDIWHIMNFSNDGAWANKFFTATTIRPELMWNRIEFNMIESILYTRRMVMEIAV